MKAPWLALALPLLSLASLAPLAPAQLPGGYVEEVWLSGLDGPVGLAVDAGGTTFLWERAGRVFLVENDAPVQPPVIDISEEVGNWEDFGLLGLALDPDFASNGRIYLFYVVDRHHLLFFGTPAYDPTADWYFAATIGRITRYELDPASGFTSTVPGSRTVLLGTDPTEGVPITFRSHGTGALCFGRDGTLLASTGDGASFDGFDFGSTPGTYWQQALNDGILRQAENVGAFRAQMIDSLSGKVLRLDPETGDGVPSNPWYDPRQPRAARSRVHTLGLRNPFRFCVRPGTGSLDPADGDPGVLYVGDVGWNDREELSVVKAPAWNLGWPIYEGLEVQPGYASLGTPNRDAPNPLDGQPGCSMPFFDFQDLLQQEHADGLGTLPNPCDPLVPIDPGTPTFMHRRPAISWGHGGSLDTRVPGFDDDGEAIFFQLGQPGCPVAGAPFGGNCAAGGLWIEGSAFGPVSGSYLAADFRTVGWMRELDFDQNDVLQSVNVFGSVGSPVAFNRDPRDGSLLYVAYLFNEVRRIRYTGSNQGPAALAQVEPGPFATPRRIRLDGTASTDPEGLPLEFLWDFGDGTSSTEASPVHVFTGSGQPEGRTVTLTVTDPLRGEDTDSIVLHLDNGAPSVEITSIADGATYSTTGPTDIDLIGDASDPEEPPSRLRYRWTVARQDGDQVVQVASFITPTASFTLQPTACEGEFHAYRVRLDVSDSQNQTTRAERWLTPDCLGRPIVTVTAPGPADRLLPGFETLVVASVSGPVDEVELRVDGQLLALLDAPPWEAPWTPEAPGPATLTALAIPLVGSSASSPGRRVDVVRPLRLVEDVTRPAADAHEETDGTVVLDGELFLGTHRISALRFPLSVPAGATVTSAHLQLRAAAPFSQYALFAVQAAALDDAPFLTGVPFELSSLPRTSASVEWLVEPWTYTGGSGAAERSPDLAQVIQEVVDRPGYQPGRSLLLLVSGVGNRRALSYAGPDSNASRLVVEYD